MGGRRARNPEEPATADAVRLAAIHEFIRSLIARTAPAPLPSGNPDALGKVEAALGTLAASLGDAPSRDSSLLTRDLRRAQASVEQLRYAVSHDLQEPLRVVVGFAELFAQRYQGSADERADQYITHIVDGARRMQKLLDDLLTVLRAGRAGNDVDMVDTAAVLTGVLSRLESACRESGAEVTRGALPVVRGDPVQIARVFRNLIENSIRFRREEPPRIDVRAERKGSEWVFSVVDNGLGFEMEHERRVFQIFQRLQAPSAQDGSGVGLALVRSIVERHQGRVWAESEPGRGSKFCFSLPAAGGSPGGLPASGTDLANPAGRPDVLSTP